MDPKCKAQVRTAAQAAGRPKPTEAQLAALESRIRGAQTRLARQDTARWRTLTADQRMQEGAAAAMADIQAEAAKKLARRQMQMVKDVEIAQRVQGIRDAFTGKKGHDGTMAEATKRDIEVTDRYVSRVRKEAQSGLMSLIEAAGSKEGTTMGRNILMRVFDAENPGMTADILREVFKNADGSTKNATATKAARAWLDTIEGMRTRFNAAGGDVGRLDYGYTPQPWDATRVRKNAAAFADKVLPHVDRSRYLREDGSRMDDDEVKTLLSEAAKTIASNGVNKIEPGKSQGTGARANRGSDGRVIHFKDGDGWLAVMNEFGKGSLYDAMMGHVGGMARDIGLVERYGPNPEAAFRLVKDQIKQADMRTGEALTSWNSVEPQTLWDIVSGKTGMPADDGLAQAGKIARDLQVASKLGGAVISSVTDLGTVFVTAGYNRLSYWQVLKDVARSSTKEGREFMNTHGMIAESVADHMNRWSGDHIGANWSGKLANSVMKWSFMNAWTDGLRQGFTMTMNAKLAEMAKKPWAELAQFDRTRFEQSGITEADWAKLNGVTATKFRGRELLTPEDIKRSGDPDLAARLLGFVDSEAEFAVVNPDLTTRAIITGGGLQAGTVKGELFRTTMQFKSFPVAMLTKHWRRMLEGTQGAADGPTQANRLAYGMAMLATTAGLGAIALQAKQVLQGKDPIDTDNPRFWVKSVAQGGGFGIAGDLFLIDPTSSYGDQASNLAKNALGPTFGSMSELVIKNITGNAWEAAAGKDTHAAAELAQWVRTNAPGNNLWWVKPAIDHGVMNALNENLSPGYLDKMEARARKEWDQRYFWAPDEPLPTRLPDFGQQ